MPENHLHYDDRRDDHIHSVARTPAGRLELSCDFDYDALDRDDDEPAPDTVDVGDVSAALVRILNWMTANTDARMTAARANSLLH